MKAGVCLPDLVRIKNELFLLKKLNFSWPNLKSEPNLILLLIQDDSSQWCLWAGSTLREIFLSYEEFPLNFQNSQDPKMLEKL